MFKLKRRYAVWKGLHNPNIAIQGKEYEIAGITGALDYKVLSFIDEDGHPNEAKRELFGMLYTRRTWLGSLLHFLGSVGPGPCLPRLPSSTKDIVAEAELKRVQAANNDLRARLHRAHLRISQLGRWLHYTRKNARHFKRKYDELRESYNIEETALPPERPQHASERVADDIIRAAKIRDLLAGVRPAKMTDSERSAYIPPDDEDETIYCNDPDELPFLFDGKAMRKVARRTPSPKRIPTPTKISSRGNRR